MAGRIKDSGDRQDAGSLRSASAGFLLNRLLYLIDHINVSLGLIDLNLGNGSFDCLTLIVDDEIIVQQEISEFLGLLFYMKNNHHQLLIPHGNKIIRLESKLGIYFI